MVQWLRLHAFAVGGGGGRARGFSLCQGTKIMPSSTAKKSQEARAHSKVSQPRPHHGPTAMSSPSREAAAAGGCLGGWYGWPLGTTLAGITAMMVTGTCAPGSSRRSVSWTSGGPLPGSLQCGGHRVYRLAHSPPSPHDEEPARPWGAALPLTPWHGFEVRQPLPSPPPLPPSVPHLGTTLVSGVVFQESG